ncbi:MAG TPA: DUF4956 domain-containing protein, partial [Longimicrobiales bacterium]|nr:DUF4956 domain-containing protein [Longimicrobiales bacterium]
MLEHLVRRSREGRGVRMRTRRQLPVIPLLLYYGALMLLGLLLIRFVPGAQDAIAAPISNVGGIDPFDATPSQPMQAEPWEGPFGRLWLTFFTAIGAVALALPVAGIYMHTRRLRYDPSLVQTIIVLPIVVAGVVLVVKNSLALAFALAGIVAGVRFRQKLNEPKDAVYVLLSLGLGLAAAVHALDIALSLSLAFNVVVLALWRFDYGMMNGAGTSLSMGDTALLTQPPPISRARSLAESEELEADGILVIHAPEPAEAQRAVALSLAGV